MTNRTLSTESEEAARAFASQRTSSQRDSAREHQGNSQTPSQAQDSGETEKVSESHSSSVSRGSSQGHIPENRGTTTILKETPRHQLSLAR